MASSELRSRRRSIESARAAGYALDSAITESWRRCGRLLRENRPSAPVDCEPDEVRTRWEDSPIRRSGIGVEAQLGRAAEAGGLIAAITDGEGRILWTSGSRTMRRDAERVGFVPGGRWDEPSAGTNALGLALLSGEPATVFSAEHWCESVRDWVCWSAPVRGPAGRPFGVLDLSGRWDTASPVAELAVAALGRLVEEHLPVDVAGAGSGLPGQLTLRLMGGPEFTLGGMPLALSPRQAEILAALAIDGPASLEQLRDRVYGERPVRSATVKAEVSHLRHLLGGGIDSRPYRLTMPVRVDALDLRRMLHEGDLGGASAAYGGQLLPDSEAPFAVDNRHLIDVTLRQSLLKGGSAAQLLRFAEVHRYDEAVLERAVALAAATDPLRYEAEACLDRAVRG